MQNMFVDKTVVNGYNELDVFNTVTIVYRGGAAWQKRATRSLLGRRMR